MRSVHVDVSKMLWLGEPARSESESASQEDGTPDAPTGFPTTHGSGRKEAEQRRNSP
jgi:hypothetical protein